VEKIELYYRLPLFCQHVATSMYGYKLKRERYTKTYRHYFELYENHTVPEQELLTDLLLHLKEKIKVYQDIEVDPENILQSFYALPQTTKEMLRESLDDHSCKDGKIMIGSTSGTTGKNLIVYQSLEDMGRRMAYLDHIKSLHGVEPFSKRASFTGNFILSENHHNKLWRRNISMNQTLYASYFMTHKNVRHVYEHMSSVRPVSIDGLPSAIHMLAQFILRNNIEIEWNVKAVFPTAETVLPHMKEDIERAFNTVVVDQYASGEGAPFLYLGPDKRYVIGSETGLFEFYRVRKNIYEMVVTSYINYATPIVRYRILDQVEIESDKDYLNSYQDNCLIKKIIGRGADYLTGDFGQKVTAVNVTWMLAGFEDRVVQYQVIQKSSSEFHINMVVDNHYDMNVDENEIKTRFKRRFGDKTFLFKYMDDIPKEKSGKVRFIINEAGETT
jgi:phenylacetate-CoA ligase